MEASLTPAGQTCGSATIDLLAAVAAHRDRDAFAELFDFFAPRLKSYLRRSGAENWAAEELVQEVMLTVWRRAEQFDRRQGSVSTWIFTIARNKRIDALRRERRPQVDPNDPALARDPDDPPDKAVETTQREGLLRSAVAELPDEQAALLRMWYFEDKSHSVIAGELAMPLGTVKTRLRNALAQLRAKLKDVA